MFDTRVSSYGGNQAFPQKIPTEGVKCYEVGETQEKICEDGWALVMLKIIHGINQPVNRREKKSFLVYRESGTN